MRRIYKLSLGRIVPGILFAASFGFAVTLAVSVTASTLQDSEMEVECEAIAAPEMIATKTGTVQVAIELTMPVGQVDSARLDPESGILVEKIESDDSTHFTLELDMSTAQAGSWELMLVGADGFCTGSLEVEDRTA